MSYIGPSSSSNHFNRSSNRKQKSKQKSSSSKPSGVPGTSISPLNPDSIALVGVNSRTNINKTINNLIDGTITIKDFKSFVDTFSGAAPQKQILQDFLLMYDPGNQDFLMNDEIADLTQHAGSQSSDSSSMYVLDQLITYNRLEQESMKPEAERVGFNQNTYNDLKSTLTDSLNKLKEHDNKAMLCSACLYLGDDTVSNPIQKINNGYKKFVPNEIPVLTNEFISEGLDQLETLRASAYSDSSLRSGVVGDVDSSTLEIDEESDRILDGERDDSNGLPTLVSEIEYEKNKNLSAVSGLTDTNTDPSFGKDEKDTATQVEEDGNPNAGTSNSNLGGLNAGSQSERDIPGHRSPSNLNSFSSENRYNKELSTNHLLNGRDPSSFSSINSLFNYNSTNEDLSVKNYYQMPFQDELASEGRTSGESTPSVETEQLFELSEIKIKKIPNNGQCLFRTLIDQRGRIDPIHKKTTEQEILDEVNLLKQNFLNYLKELDQNKVIEGLFNEDEGSSFELLIQQFNENDDTWYAVGDQSELYGIKKKVRNLNADIISQQIINFALDQWEMPIANVECDSQDNPVSVLLLTKDNGCFNQVNDNQLDQNWITMIHVNENHYNSAIFPKVIGLEDVQDLEESPPTSTLQFDLNEIKDGFINKFDIHNINNTEKPEFYIDSMLDALKGPFDLSKAPEPPLTYFGTKNVTEFLVYLKELVSKHISTPSINSVDQSVTDINKFCEELTKTLSPILKENINSPEYFSMFVLKLNEKLAVRHQELTEKVEFSKDKDVKFTSKLKNTIGDIGFNTPKVESFDTNNIKVSICEVNGRKRETQEDQYHVGQLDIERQKAPTVLKNILQKCETSAKEKIYDESGSTATLTHLSTQGVLTVAAVGDAPAIFFAKNKQSGTVKMIPLTHDHEPVDFFERSRIYEQGGRVINKSEVMRVDGILNLTRAIGDFNFKELNEQDNEKKGDHISSEPDVVQIDVSNYLNENYDVCVLNACDGILNHGDANRQNYADLFGLDKSKDNQSRNFAQRCVDYALNSQSSDNITVIATELNELPKTGILTGVFDGHGGKQTSAVCKNVVENFQVQSFSG